MQNIYSAIIKKDNGWWIGWIKEVPGVNCQERTRKALIESLKITLREALEFNEQDALVAAGDDYQEEQIAVWKEFACKGKAFAVEINEQYETLYLQMLCPYVSIIFFVQIK
jgi:predicted RNase H-like HicB family nuclease